MLKNLVLPANTQVSRWQEQNMFFGGVHGVAVNDWGELTATGDLPSGWSRISDGGFLDNGYNLQA
jgi:hypothetical protein